MRTTLLLFLSFIFSSGVFASVHVRFVVENEVTRQAIDGVKLEIIDESLSCITDELGRAVLERVKPGRYSLLVEKEGYLPYHQRITIDNRKKLTITLLLTPHTTFEERITVVSEPLELGIRELSSARVATIAGVGENPFKAMARTPGILSPSEGDSRLYIRGSPPWENLILLDDVPLYDPYRLFGLVTLFDPATVSYFTIWPGGFPAQYGNRLSAVVEVYNRYGTTEKTLSGSANLSFTNTSLLAEGKLPFLQGQASWLLTVRRTYYDILLNALNTGPSEFPYFFDVQGRLYYQPSNKHEFSFFSILSHEGTDMSEEIESEYTTVAFDAVDDQDSQIMGFHHYFHLSNRTLLTTILSYYKNEQATDFSVIVGEEAYQSQIILDLETKEWMFQEKIVWAVTPEHSFETGVIVAQNDAKSLISFVSDDPAITVPPELYRFSAESGNAKFGFYLQDQWSVSKKIILRPGVRFDYGSISGFQTWSPRFTFSYALSEQKSIKGGWGIYYQFPSYETLQGEGLLYNLENLDQLQLDPEIAYHYILGFEDQLPGSCTWSIELYRKELRNLIVGRDVEYDVLVLNDDLTTQYRTIETTGIEPYNGEEGYAHGAEILLQKDNLWKNRLSFQLSYALAETRAHKEGESRHFRRYDQTHTINLLGNLSLTKKWDISFVWRYGSGFPYSPLGEILTIVEDANGNGQYDPKEGERLSYLEINNPDSYNSRRFPTYHRLDARLNFNLDRKLFSATFYIDIINLYDRKNIQSFEYSRDFSERNEVSGLPFLPTFGVHIYF